LDFLLLGVIEKKGRNKERGKTRGKKRRKKVGEGERIGEDGGIVCVCGVCMCDMKLKDTNFLT
jgi:hypothetical protein